MDKLSSYFKAVGDPNRMKMMKIFGSHEQNTLNVSDEAKILGISQPATTKHLKILENVGLLSHVREGTSVYYAVNKDMLIKYRNEVNMACERVYTPCANNLRCSTCPIRETCM